MNEMICCGSASRSRTSTCVAIMSWHERRWATLRRRSKISLCKMKWRCASGSSSNRTDVGLPEGKKNVDSLRHTEMRGRLRSANRRRLEELRSRPKDHLIRTQQSLRIRHRARRKVLVAKRQLTFAGIAGQRLAVDGADPRVHIGFFSHTGSQGGGLVAQERAVHHEELLERRRVDLAAGAVHRGFGKGVLLQEVVQAAAADPGVDCAAIVAGTVEIE